MQRSRATTAALAKKTAPSRFLPQATPWPHRSGSPSFEPSSASPAKRCAAPRPPAGGKNAPRPPSTSPQPPACRRMGRCHPRPLGHREPQPLRPRRILRRRPKPHPRQSRHHGTGPQLRPQHPVQERRHQRRTCLVEQCPQPRPHPSLQGNIISVEQPWPRGSIRKCVVLTRQLLDQVGRRRASGAREVRTGPSHVAPDPTPSRAPHTSSWSPDQAR